MPSKRRRVTGINRRRKKLPEESQSKFIYLQTSYEKNLEKIESDLRTIPDQTFGKVYSTQIIEQNSSPNTSTVIDSDIILAPRPKTRKTKKKRK